jgi:hypothetical protein
VATKRRSRQSLKAGPWNGVRNTLDPFDGDPRELLDAVNMYVPDPSTGSGAYQRPGFSLLNEDPLGVSPYLGQGVYTHYDIADPFSPLAPPGGAFRFCVFGGKFYRADATLSTFTDVTPVGITIDPSARVYFASLNGYMVVTDGVHRPWYVAPGGFAVTPLVGVNIDVDGSGSDWTAFGQPVVYGGALFFILQTYSAVAASSSIVWSEPNDVTTGYFQAPTFDNLWTLEQTSASPIYALAATNAGMYYFREQSIGTIAGVVGPDLQANATHDAIAWNVGTRSPQTVQQFGDIIYFCDVVGRPYRMAQGNAPEPIWEQLRAVIDSSEFGFPSITQAVASAVVDPSLNLYLAAIWSYSPASRTQPIEIQAFDARTGKYAGRWQLAGGTGDGDGIYIDAMGIWFDTEGRATCVVQGSDIGPTAGTPTHGFLWGMNSLTQAGQTLAAEDEVDWLAEEDGVTLLVTEGLAQVYLDGDAQPYVDITTLPLGYADDTIWTADTVTIITGTSTSCAVRVSTPTTLNTLEGSPTPASSLDDTFRLICGLDAVQGRGISVTVAPALTADSDQWSVQRVVVVATPSIAGPEEP